MKEPRYLAVELLCRTFRHGSYTNIQLGHGLSNSGMTECDKRLCSVIYYGVVERKITLDYIIGGLCSRPVNKLDDVVLNILRCGIYQILYMDNIPDSAAVNESVSLTKKLGKTSASGLVNAVLRGFIRQGRQLRLPKDTAIAASVMYSAPVWLTETLSADYGPEHMADLLSDALEKPPVTIHMNRLRCTAEELSAALGSIDILKVPEIPDCFELSGGNPAETEAFKKGFFHVQDKASQLCCMALAPQENDLVLDICAAPGGKTFTMAEMMQGRGELYAFDLHEKRVKLIRDGAQRLGLENIRAAAGNASVFNPELPQFDKILCDVPCSGIGAVRRKPEIKYKNPEDFEGLPSVQYAIAENALNYLRVGGEMVYSTCTLRKAENDDVVKRLLENHPELEPVTFLEELGCPFGSGMATIFPEYFRSDGFFIAKFRKIKEASGWKKSTYLV